MYTHIDKDTKVTLLDSRQGLGYASQIHTNYLNNKHIIYKYVNRVKHKP